MLEVPNEQVQSQYDAVMAWSNRQSNCRLQDLQSPYQGSFGTSSDASATVWKDRLILVQGSAHNDIGRLLAIVDSVSIQRAFAGARPGNSKVLTPGRPCPWPWKACMRWKSVRYKVRDPGRNTEQTEQPEVPD